MRNIFAPPAWEPALETKICSSCGIEGAPYSVNTGRRINGKQLHARYYCSEFCQRTFELFIFRKCEANDERRRIFSSKSPSGLNTM